MYWIKQYSSLATDHLNLEVRKRPRSASTNGQSFRADPVIVVILMS